MNQEINTYNNIQASDLKAICNLLAKTIDSELVYTERKIWHSHPVWFIEGNPIVGYSKQNAGIRLMFWSGAGFSETELNVRGAKFKDASIFYNSISEVKIKELKRWLKKAASIQWDYKNLIKRKGKLEPLKGLILKSPSRTTVPYGLKKFNSIDEYHAACSKDIRNILDLLRKTILQAAPDSTEVISYNMPAFKLKKVLVYYAVHKEHIGFYPTSFPITIFKMNY